MQASTNELARQVAATAIQLKAAQVDFADHEPAERRDFYAGIIEGALSGVLPDRREAFLAALQSHFPCWTELAGAEPAAAAAAPPAPEDPDTLADRLIELTRLMDDDEKQQLVARLREGGLAADAAPAPEGAAAAGSGALPARTQQALRYLMAKVQIGQLDLTRTVKLLQVLLDFAAAGDQVIWNTWRTIAPRSALRRPCDLRKAMAGYLAGEHTVSGVDLARHVELLRKLMASLIAGVGQAGAQFAQQHALQFAPEEIEAHVNRAGSSLLTATEYRCWSRYVEMARDRMIPEAIEHAIKEAISGYTESMIDRSA